MNPSLQRRYAIESCSLVINADYSFNQNAFSEKLGPYGFNFFAMFVIDLMHEFELGVWKALFIHLLRILNAENPNLVHTLDQRYVHIPLYVFGINPALSKLPPGTDLWQRYYSKICEQHLGVEETCCS